MGQTSGIKQVQSLQHDTHEIAKPSSLNEQKNSKVTSYWILLHAITVQAAMAVHGAHQWQCSNSTHRRAVAIT